MTPNQPLPTYPSAATGRPPRIPEATRLLGLWAELARLAASAAAHGHGDEPALRRLQVQVEEAITDRFPDQEARMDELLVWESGLFHVAETPPETCLICRKARLELPLDLPLPILGGVS